MQIKIISILRISIAAILLFLLFYLSPILNCPANAQTNKPIQFLRISPVILNISLSPGKTYNYEIELENLLNTPLPLKAELDKLYINEDCKEINIPKEESPLISWVKIDPIDFIIPSKSKKTTTVTITIPDKIPLGGYYAMIFFQPLFPQKNNNLSQIQSKIGLPILANIGLTPPKESRGQIYSFTLDHFFNNGDQLGFKLLIKNNSPYHFSAKPFFIIKPLLGQQKKIEIEEKIILPGKIRSWLDSITIDKLITGVYPISIVVSTGEGFQISIDSVFIKFPTTNTLTILVIFSLLIFVIARKKQIIKAFKSLIE